MKARSAFGVLFSLAMLFNAAYACEVPDTRVCDIDAKLRALVPGHEVRYQAFSVPIPEWEWCIGNCHDTIHLNRTTDYSDDELFFVLAHEFGHSALKHGHRHLARVASAEDLKSMSDLELFRKYEKQVVPPPEEAGPMLRTLEFEADAFAVKAMVAYGKPVIMTMLGLLKVTYTDETHPSKVARIAQARKILATIEAQAADIRNVALSAQ